MHLGHYKAALVAKHDKHSHVPLLDDQTAQQDNKHSQEHGRLLALKPKFDDVQVS